MNAKRWLLLLSVMLLGCGEPTAPVDVKVTVTNIPPGTTALKVTARLGEKDASEEFSAGELRLNPTSTSHQSATFTLRLRSGGEGTLDLRVAAMLDDCEMSINQQASQISLDPMLSRQGTVMLARKRYTVTIMKPVSTTIDGNPLCTGRPTCSITNIDACSKFSIESSEDHFCSKLEYEGACHGEKCDISRIKADETVVIKQSPSICNPLTKTDRALRAVWMKKNMNMNEAWAVGDKLALKWDGNSWSPKGMPTNDLDLYSTATGNQTWAVGRSNTIFNFNGSNWIPNTIAGSTGCTADKDLILYGIYIIQNMIAVSAGYHNKDGGCIVIHNGTTWESVRKQPDWELRSVWAANATDIWVVGLKERKDPNVVHYDGAILYKSSTGWKEVLPDDGKEKPLRAVWGFDVNGVKHIWAVGNKGLILHWDGTSWSRDGNFSGPNLNSVWGQGTDLWVVGDDGIVLHRSKINENSVNWQSSVPTPKNLNGVFGIGNDVWVVGDGGTALHYVNGVLQPNPK